MPTLRREDWEKRDPRDHWIYRVLAVLIPLAALVLTVRACCG